MGAWESGMTVEGLVRCTSRQVESRDESQRSPVSLTDGCLGPALPLQEAGNYKAAHTLLLTSIKQLEGMGLPAPPALLRALCLLHRCVIMFACPRARARCACDAWWQAESSSPMGGGVRPLRPRLLCPAVAR